MTNKGTVTHIETDAKGRFKLLYVGFGVAIQAFLTSMRPLIIIDEAHLKGTYEGTNLLAVGMDNNNQIVPIVTGVCQGGESMEAWSFFLSKLKESIGVVQDMTVISDRHPGIVSACATIFPNAFNGNTTVKETYKELVYPLQGPSSWETPADKQNVLPPTMEKRMAGRPSNNDHFRAREESRDKTSCVDFEEDDVIGEDRFLARLFMLVDFEEDDVIGEDRFLARLFMLVDFEEDDVIGGNRLLACLFFYDDNQFETLSCVIVIVMY
nr:transposase, MuDR, MULE transposase domain protein [Tanacetum cinerariifolium]